MTENELHRLRRDELITKAEDYGLLDEINENATEKGEPTKKELVRGILTFVEAQKEEEAKNNGSNLAMLKSPTERRKLQKADLLRKECVIIIDNQNLTTKLPGRYITWGDRNGIYTDFIDFENDTGAYVRRGALNYLRKQKFTHTVQSGQKNVSSGQAIDTVVTKNYPRYSVIPTDGLTPAQIAQMKVEQKGKLAFEMNSI